MKSWAKAVQYFENYGSNQKHKGGKKRLNFKAMKILYPHDG